MHCILPFILNLFLLCKTPVYAIHNDMFKRYIHVGMMRYDARLLMEERLTALSLYRGKEPNKMRLGLCSRSGDVIEPMLTPQW